MITRIWIVVQFRRSPIVFPVAFQPFPTGHVADVQENALLTKNARCADRLRDGMARRETMSDVSSRIVAWCPTMIEEPVSTANHLIAHLRRIRNLGLLDFLCCQAKINGFAGR